MTMEEPQSKCDRFEKALSDIPNRSALKRNWKNTNPGSRDSRMSVRQIRAGAYARAQQKGEKPNPPQEHCNAASGHVTKVRRSGIVTI
jgi:hypothetical protein